MTGAPSTLALDARLVVQVTEQVDVAAGDVCSWLTRLYTPAAGASRLLRETWHGRRRDEEAQLPVLLEDACLVTWRLDQIWSSSCGRSRGSGGSLLEWRRAAAALDELVRGEYWDAPDAIC